MSNFHPFERSRLRSAREPWVTIHKDGRYISMNQGSLQLLHSPQAVELSFDPDAKLIGIRAAQSGEGKSYFLKSARNGVQYISGMAFTRHWQIDTSVARRYKVYMDGVYLVLDLKTESIAFTIPRSKFGARNSQKGSGGISGSL